MSTDIELLPLPKWLLEGFTDPTIERLCDYARAVAEHNVAARDAEIEALRADVEAWKSAHGAENDACHHFQGKAREAETRAERLAEALRDALECGNDGDWQSARQYITAALRDHDQEGKDG